MCRITSKRRKIVYFCVFVLFYAQIFFVEKINRLEIVLTPHLRYWRLPLSTRLSRIYLYALIFICENLFLLNPFLACENIFKPSLFVKIFFYLCPSVRISFSKYILKTAVLRRIFRGSNFEVPCSEMNFLREQLYQFSDL